MGHIFISYSHKDSLYVHKLTEALEQEGFEVWIDDRIHYGSEWPKVVTRNLDISDGVIVVLSNNSYESDMVQNEVTRAREKKKPIFPLLLEGENWLIVQAKQFVDVKDGSLPTEKFYKRLEGITPRKNKKVEREIAEKIRRDGVEQEAAEKVARDKAEHKATANSSKTQSSQKQPINVASFMSVMAVVFCVASVILIPILGSLSNKSEPTPQIKLTNTFEVVSLPSSTVAVKEIPSLTSAPVITTMPTLLPTEITDAKDESMVLVPAGEFYMGSSCAEVGCVYKQGGQIEYTEAYWIDKTEVANAKYAECVEVNICTPPIEISLSKIPDYYGNVEYDNYPVVNITFEQAESYCDWLGGRLPTNKEWEKAARGTDGRGFPWGIDFQGFEANSCDIHCSDLNSRNDDFNDGYKYTAPVNSFLEYQSPYGTLNMAGNVREIVKEKDVRGGAWNTPARLLWIFSLGFGDTAPSNAIGFRCAKDAP